MKPCRHPVERLLPHAHPMILIDEIVGHERNRLSAAVAIQPGIPFFEDGRGVAAHIAIEWMAQSCAALIGIAALDAGEKVRLGLLLGTRNFKATVPWFREGERLLINVSLAYRDAQMGVFDCAVTRDPAEGTVATAQLTTYQPANVADLIAMQGREPVKASSGA